jgi:hypothetical protein
MESTENKWMRIGKSSLWFLFIYYIIIYLLATCTCIWMVLGFPGFKEEIDIFTKAIFGSILSALSGSTLYYIRKLYKNAIQNNIIGIEPGNQIQSIGVFIYFFIRPLVSLIAGPIIVLGLYGSIFKIMSIECQPQNSFLYISMFLSFIGGFTIGNFIQIVSKSNSIFWKKYVF